MNERADCRRTATQCTGDLGVGQVAVVAQDHRSTLACRELGDRIVELVGASRGIPRAQVALAWLLSKPGVTAPIVGASKPHHLEDAVAALSVHLTPEEMTALEEPYVPHPVLGFS